MTASPDPSYDVVILGGGTGGYTAAIRAAQLGLKTALVERDKVGGTCLHRGCIPTKALLHSAELLSLFQRRAEFGLTAESPGYDWAGVRHYQHSAVDRLFKGVTSLVKGNGVEMIAGEGRLTSPRTVQVTGSDGQTRTFQTQHVILATGSRPKDLPGLPADGDRILNSDQILTIPDVPRSLAILGAGAVGVEFASLYRDFGVEVTLVELLPGLVPLEDEAVGQALERSYRERGIRTLTSARLLIDRTEQTTDGLSLTVETAQGTETLQAERLLVAVGRTPNLEDMGLETLEVAVEGGFVRVDARQRTNVPGVWAIGDAVGGYLLAHKAGAEGVVAVETIAGQPTVPIESWRVPRATYCRPEIASFGLSEAEARAAGHAVQVGVFPFRANARAVILNERDGFVKLVADRDTDDLLGAHLIGPKATDLLAEPVLARLFEASPREIALSVHAHPTLTEAVGEAALAIDNRAIHILNNSGHSVGATRKNE